MDDGIAALELLEDFLKKETLTERPLHLETRLSETELVGSVLNGKLPEAMSISVDVHKTISLEDLVDFFYYVDFQCEDGNLNPQTILTTEHSDSSPKVVVDPFLDLFLDLFGGRFEGFASKLTKDGKGETFQVIISGGAACYQDAGLESLSASQPPCRTLTRGPSCKFRIRSATCRLVPQAWLSQ